MPKFPEPPPVADLAALGTALHPLPAGTRIWRTYFRAGAHPTTWDQFRSWGPTKSRFDHHPPPAQLHPDRAILYGALGGRAAITTIAEVFQATRTVERARRSPAWVAFDTTADLQLLDLSGTWPTKAGASMVINSGPRPRAQRWSRAFHDAFPDIDGVLYPSSMNANEPAAALYERAKRVMPAHPRFHRQLADPTVLTMLKNACFAVNYALL